MVQTLEFSANSWSGILDYTIPLVIVLIPNIFASKNYRIHNVNSCGPSLSFALFSDNIR